MTIVEIDKHSGFCLGVVKAINKAEKFLGNNEMLYSLGDIVHNDMEIDRLEKKGLQTIDYNKFSRLNNVSVLLRAHGEPPKTYELAKRHGINIVDATCPVVIGLQARIRKVYEAHKDDNTQIAIFGKSGHAEVVGLLGQTDNKAIVLEKVSDADKLDFSRPVFLFSQTTKSLDEFRMLVSYIKENMETDVSFEYRDTICRQVTNRLPHLRDFAAIYDRVLFVSGSKSSNGKELFEACHQVNKNTFFLSTLSDFKFQMIEGAKSIGICGATSTPFWLMEEVKKQVETLLTEDK